MGAGVGQRAMAPAITERKVTGPVGSTPKVGVVVDGFEGGGAELCAAELAVGLARRGYAVDLVVFRDVNDRAPALPDSVRLLPLRKPRALATFPDLVRYISRERPAALVGTGDAVNWLLVAARMASRARPRLALWQQSPLYWALDRRESVKKRLTPRVNRVFYRHADAVVAVSHGLVRDLERIVGLDPSRVRIIRPGLISPRLFELAAAPVDLQRFFPSPDPAARVVVTAGHLQERKGHETLLRAIRRAREAENVRLLILGEGHQRSRLENLGRELGLGDALAMPGWAANPYPLFKAADLVVLASWWEASPRVLVEALALGAPVVSTDCDYGPREILQNGRLGRLVPVRDDAAMAEAILATLREPRRPAPIEALREYTEEEMVHRFVEVLALEQASSAPHERHKGPDE